MASQLPNFTLELRGDMKANWEYFCETFESYVTLMDYRPKYTAKEMAALKYARHCMTPSHPQLSHAQKRYLPDMAH